MVGSLGKILIDDALDVSVRLEARRHYVRVGDGLEKQPQKSRVLDSFHGAIKYPAQTAMRYFSSGASTI